MTKEIKSLINKYSDIAMSSVINNRHMNELTREDLPNVGTLTNHFVRGFLWVFMYQENYSYSLSDLNRLTNKAKKRKRDKFQDALLVDFINFIGICLGIDYALYTIDLST